MRLTGNMVLELTDVVTGDVERIEESNMVMKAVNDLINIKARSALIHID